MYMSIARTSRNFVHVCTCTHMYMKIHVPSMLAIGVETINKQTNKQPQWLIKFIKHSHHGLENKQPHNGLENIKAATQWLRKY